MAVTSTMTMSTAAAMMSWVDGNTTTGPITLSVREHRGLQVLLCLGNWIDISALVEELTLPWILGPGVPQTFGIIITAVCLTMEHQIIITALTRYFWNKIGGREELSSSRQH